MKRELEYTLLIILSTLLINGCVDIEETPESLLSPETFYSSEDAFDAAVIGCYRPLFGAYAGYDYWYGACGSIGADDVGSITDVLAAMDMLDFDPDNWMIADIWKMYYSSLNNANAIIGNLDKVEGVAQDKIDEFEGQARFLRAFCYFNLTRYFGQVPLITFENQAQADKVGQSPESEIYDLIIEDLKIAEDKLPDTFPEHGRVTKGAAKTLLASVYLTMTGWPIEDPSYYPLARDKAKEVMDMGLYQLEADFADLWKVENKLTNTEFIFTLHGISGQGWEPGSHMHVASRPTPDGGWIDFNSEERFFNAFPEGPRKDASFYTVFIDGSHWSEVNPKQPFIAKYLDAGPTVVSPDGVILEYDGDGFFVVLRYADVLLTYAEAANMAENGPSAQALEAVNKVRRRAMGLDCISPDPAVDLPSGMSVTEFDKAVLDERGWELAFENHRWFDLVRKKMVVEVNQDLYPNVTEKCRLWAKPSLQVILTEGLEQNTGY
jgi:hypothetical protein